MAIEANLVIAHASGMGNTVEKLLHERTANELRPERIGHRLYLLRCALGLKSAEMADNLGIERTYWSRFEKGRRPITPQFAALVRDRTGITLDYIMLGDTAKVPLDIAQKITAIENGTVKPVPEE